MGVDKSKAIESIENEIMALGKKLEQLRKGAKPTPVKNYTFQDSNGEVSLLELFGERDVLFAIHNMGQACRYCTLWADGLNGFVPHLEDKFSVVLLSKDEPAVQKRFANSRGWRFPLASHGGGAYIKEQNVRAGGDNMPGIVVYERKGKKIFKKNSAGFGPGDLYCSLWHILGLAGFSDENWTPQYNYWQRPKKLEDGGKNL